MAKKDDTHWFDIDVVSGQSMKSINDGLKQWHVGGDRSFEIFDGLTEPIFPAVFGALKNCLQKPLQKHPIYKEIEFVWAGSTSEGVNIPNMERRGRAASPFLEFEMDILCVFKDMKIGTKIDDPVIMVRQEGTTEGYFLLYVKDTEYRKRWEKFCFSPKDPKRKGEMYLNPLLLVEDLHKQIEHIFEQIPLLKEKFRLELNPPAVTITMLPESTGDEGPKVIITCDIVVAIELPYSSMPKNYSLWVQVHGHPNWLSKDKLQTIQKENLHLVGKCSPKGISNVEWRLSFNRIELTLFKEIKQQFPTAITCYRILKMVCYWHLKHPDFLHSYHLKMIFLKTCHNLPSEFWTESNIATSFLGLLDSLLHCLALHSIPSYFLPDCNLIEGVHPDFILSMMKMVSKIRKDPMNYVINIQR